MTASAVAATRAAPAADTAAARALRAATTGKRGDLLALLAGAPLLLSFAPFGWYALAVLSQAILFATFLGVTPRRAAWRGFLFGFAGFLGGTYWLYISLHQFGKAPLYIAVPMMLGLVAVMASYFALAGWLAGHLCQRHQGRAAGTLALGLPAIMVYTEWLRSWVATGFPWFSWGYSQTDSPLVGLAPVIGVFGVSLAVSVSGGLLLLALAGRTRVTQASAGAAFVALWVGAWGLVNVEWSQPMDAPLEAGLVQGGISQDLKWQAEQLPKTKKLYRSLTDEHWDADLLIWPEAAIPALANRELDYFTDLFAAARSSDTALLIGAIQSKGPRGDRRYFNSVFGVDADGASEYHKRHLVPFGEYYPVPNFVRRWLADLDLPYTDFAKGPADQEPLMVAGRPVGVSICYEDAFGSELLAMVPQAQLLVNVSNDAWFGGSVAPHQHLQIARMRAIEVARPMIRSTNSGISAFIEHDGRISAVTDLFEARVLRAQVQPRTGATPYALAGDWPVLLLALLMGLGAWVRGPRGDPKAEP